MKAVILDLRNNPGGFSPVLAVLRQLPLKTS